MQRKTWHLALDFFILGAVVPILLLLIWKQFFEHGVRIEVQEVFLKIAFVLWPTGMQILIVPHFEADFGHMLTIAIMVAQNAILYSILALLVAWVVGRLRHHTHTPQLR